jgi:hypothetical protein
MSEKGRIRKFLIEEKHLNPFEAERFVNLFLKYSDICEEFLSVVESGKIPENGVESDGWSAKILSEKLPHLEIQNIYEFIVGLREEPEKYEQYIGEGAPIR